MSYETWLIVSLGAGLISAVGYGATQDTWHLRIEGGIGAGMLTFSFLAISGLIVGLIA